MSPPSDDGKVVHYHVKQTENKHYYIITEDHQFPTIRDLIAHHKRGKGGKCTRSPILALSTHEKFTQYYHPSELVVVTGPNDIVYVKTAL